MKPRLAVALACLCAAAGLLTVYPAAAMLLSVWQTDDLKSMGLVVPFVCAGLILRQWKTLGWETEGTWWGFAVLVGSAGLVFLREQTLLIVTVNKNWLLQLPPLPLVAVVYAAAMVLLFGGVRLLKASWFPVLLMWAVIPVPQSFAGKIDLPLQHASATVARAWAHVLGEQLTQDKLRLMFTPEFGMFIAPGCNGIRGAITLGLAALVVSYLYRFRWFVFAPVVAGAVLLGYLFNFLRLCLLVVWYKLALPHPWMQHHAKIADYVIGGCLFVCALLVFFAVANKLRREPKDVLPEPVGASSGVSGNPHLEKRDVGHPYLWKVAAVLVLSAVFGVDALKQAREERESQAAQAKTPPLPAEIGGWKLTRTWTDETIEGWVIYVWGEYTGPDGAKVSLGISPRLGVHDAEVCHIARGEDPKWHGQITDAAADGDVELTAAMYNNGVTQKLEASTVCTGGKCAQFSDSGQHVTLVYARPEGRLPMGAANTRPVPVLLKVESDETTVATSVMEPKLAGELAAFLKGADLVGIARPYSKR